MKTQLNQVSKTKVEINFEVPWEEMKPFLDDAAKELSKNMNVSGFRPGAVPRDMVEKSVGQEKVWQKGLELLVKQHYPQVVSENKLEPVGRPQLEIKKMAEGNPVAIKLTVDTIPELQLPDYKKIAGNAKKQEEEISVSEKEIEDTLGQIQKSRAKYKEKTEGAKEGDWIKIEYSSSQIENGKTYEDGFVLGKGQFIPGFENNLKEMKKEGEKDFSVTFPEEGKSGPFLSPEKSKELAGKQVNFHVKIKEVKEIELPEVNDEFAKSLGKFQGLDEVKKNIHQGIKQEKENKQSQQRREEILKNISSEMDIEVPWSLVSAEVENMVSDLKKQINNQLGISFEQYLQNSGKSEEQLREEYKEKATQKVKNFLILREVGKKEGIQVTQEEIDKVVNQFLEQYKGKEKDSQFDSEKLKEYYRGAIFNEKVLQTLESYSK